MAIEIMTWTPREDGRLKTHAPKSVPVGYTVRNKEVRKIGKGLVFKTTIYTVFTDTSVLVEDKKYFTDQDSNLRYGGLTSAIVQRESINVENLQFQTGVFNSRRGVLRFRNSLRRP